VSSDWVAIDFFHKVSDQYINQTPMGAGKGQPAILTVRLEGIHAALKLYDYPESQWAWLTDTANLIHRLLHKIEEVEWLRETGKSYRDITIEDVTDGET
jgi:hypothetical protein